MPENTDEKIAREFDRLAPKNDPAKQLNPTTETILGILHPFPLLGKVYILSEVLNSLQIAPDTITAAQLIAFEVTQGERKPNRNAMKAVLSAIAESAQLLPPERRHELARAILDE